MKQIRNNVFETNSSSTHSIAIPKSFGKISGVAFRVDEFGWGFNIADPADYFYTAIYETSDTEEEVSEKIRMLKDILDAHGIDYDFSEPKTHIWHDDYDNKDYLSLDDGYIDHGGELKEFVDMLLNNGDKLVRFLSGGLVFTGNDNCSTEQSGFIDRNIEYIDDYDWRTKQEFKIKNPYYMSDHEDYEWHWKGN